MVLDLKRCSISKLNIKSARTWGASLLREADNKCLTSMVVKWVHARGASAQKRRCDMANQQRRHLACIEPSRTLVRVAMHQVQESLAALEVLDACAQAGLHAKPLRQQPPP